MSDVGYTEGDYDRMAQADFDRTQEPPDPLREALEELVESWNLIRPAVTIVGSGALHQRFFDALQQARAALAATPPAVPADRYKPIAMSLLSTMKGIGHDLSVASLRDARRVAIRASGDAWDSISELDRNGVPAVAEE